NKRLPVPKLIESVFMQRDSLSANRWNSVGLKSGDKIILKDNIKAILIRKLKTDLDFAQHVLIKHSDGNREDTVNLANNWTYNSDDGNPVMVIDAVNFRNSGDYEILFQNVANEYKGFQKQAPVSVLKFTVVSPVAFSFKQILFISLVILFFAATVIFAIVRSNKHKLSKLDLQKESVKNELNTVRSQLNPHFVFNALSGIQNLMNNNQIEYANNYLSKFANLTRQILDDRELITIEDEVKLLQDYLSMEQLRFQFTVEFNVDQAENFKYTEIPTMLLQPFVENAVKHGVASLGGNGHIAVSLFKEKENIVLIVTDNGKGFERNDKTKGLGLKLSEKRIALLNMNYESCPIVLNIELLAGTVVRITLTNWLV
ncbi:MAG: sensor histidine kinase, partial [Pedobacter sp.]